MTPPIDTFDGELVHGFDSRLIGERDRVLLGDTCLELREWAHLTGVPLWIVMRRLSKGDMVIEALRGDREPGDERRDDRQVARFIDENPSGATLLEVGAFFGLTRERIRQIQEVALAKVARRLGPEWSRHIAAVLAEREGEEIAA